MKNLQIDERNARKFYATASPEFRATLENTFGKEFFAVKITDRIKTVEDAFLETGRPKVDFSNVPEDLRTYFEGQYEAVVVTEALNEGKKPDWDDDDELKWRPWFDMSPSSFGFNCAVYVYSIADAGSGSRLQNLSEELAEYSGLQFRETWKKVQLG